MRGRRLRAPSAIQGRVFMRGFHGWQQVGQALRQRHCAPDSWRSPCPDGSSGLLPASAPARAAWAHVFQRGAGAQRRMEITALRSGQQLDADHVGGVLGHLHQPACAMRDHRHMVFLVGRGRDRVNAGGVGALLVFETSAAAVTCGIMKPEFRPGRGSGTPAGRTPGPPASPSGAR